MPTRIAKFWHAGAAAWSRAAVGGGAARAGCFPEKQPGGLGRNGGGLLRTQCGASPPLPPLGTHLRRKGILREGSAMVAAVNGVESADGVDSATGLEPMPMSISILIA